MVVFWSFYVVVVGMKGLCGNVNVILVDSLRLGVVGEVIVVFEIDGVVVFGE